MGKALRGLLPALKKRKEGSLAEVFAPSTMEIFWLLISGGAKEMVDRIAREQSLSQAQRLDLLAEENVRLQIKHLKNLSLIKNMHRKGDLPRIHGWIYAVDSGRLKVLVDGGKQV